MRNILTTLVTLMAAPGCAQILGADEYEVDPSAFEEKDASADDATGQDDEPDADVDDDSDDAPDDDDDDPSDDDDETDDDPPDDDDDADDQTDDDLSDDDDETDDDPPDDDDDADDQTDASVPDDTDDDVTDEPDDTDDTDDDVTDELDDTDDVDDDITDEPDDTDDGAIDGGPIEDPCDLPELGTCNTYTQCGCDDGQMCTVSDFSTGETICVAEGTRAPGEPCQYIEECQAGYLCLFGVCSSFCDGDDESCTGDENAACIQGQTDVGPVPGAFGCTRTCDPVNPALEDNVYLGCTDGSNCYSAEGGQSFCLAPAGDGQAGDPCGTVDAPDLFACAPGFACVVFADAATCAKNCEVGSQDCGGEACTAYSPASYAVDRQIGYCDPDNTCPDLGDSCDPITQCGCDSGDRCAVIDETDGTLGCVPEGASAEGNQCSPESYSCSAGECLSYASEEDGVCVPYCYSADDCPNVDGGCMPRTWGEPGICARGCDPRDPTSDQAPFMSCGAGQTCIVRGDYSYCAPQYAFGEVGASCTLDDECLPGLGCGIAVEEGWVCGAWCELGGSDCTYGAQCQPHADDGELGPFVAVGTPMGTCELPTFSLSNTTSIPIPDAVDEPGVVTSSIAVPDTLGLVFGIAIEINITHTYVGDIEITLYGPDGTPVLLFVGIDLGDNAAGANLEQTVLFDMALTPVTDGVPPMTGEYSPVEPLQDQLGSSPEGFDPAGSWELEVVDSYTYDAGTLNSWRLVLY